MARVGPCYLQVPPTEGPHSLTVSLIPLWRGRGRCSGVRSRPTHLLRNLLVSHLVGVFEQALRPARVAVALPSLTTPPALIRTSCGWGLCCAWCWVGEGRQAAGLEREIRNKWCGGGQGLAKCPPWPGQCPLRVGHLGEWVHGDPGCGRTGPLGTWSDPCPPCPAWAEVAPRSKRRCVLERKQPYSGDEWCSGPDSEEDDKPIGATHSECPLLPGSCGPWCPRDMSALREPPSPHLQRPESEREQGSGTQTTSFPSHLSLGSSLRCDSLAPAFQVLSEPLFLGTEVGWGGPSWPYHLHLLP